MKSKEPSPATLGKEWVRSTQGDISIAPAGSGRPRSRSITSMLDPGQLLHVSIVNSHT